jgi:hypothetical protein
VVREVAMGDSGQLRWKKRVKNHYAATLLGCFTSLSYHDATLGYEQIIGWLVATSIHSWLKRVEFSEQITST